MVAELWEFSAVDTLFFRDGTPFNAGEGGQTEINGLFPPYMNTLQGVIRTTLAYSRGWKPGEPLPKELGDSDHLGLLELQGPYLLKDGSPLFAAPALLLKTKNEHDGYVRLIPGEKITCDIGHVQLPMPEKNLQGLKPLTGEWLTRAGMEKVLSGGVPERSQVFSENTLWHSESRVGIELNTATGTAMDGKLYSSTHVRLAPNISLGVVVSGVPEDWGEINNSIVPLGGEGRMANLAVANNKLAMPSPPTIKTVDGIAKFTVILITPGCYQDTKQAILEGPPGVPGKCVSACIGKLEQVGGWDLKNKQPRPMQPLLPAGSTWFFQAEEELLPEIYALHGQCIGNKVEYGYGQILIGSWGE